MAFDKEKFKNVEAETKKNNCDIGIIFTVDSVKRTYTYLSYGINAKKCAVAKAIAEQIAGLIEKGFVQI